MKLRWLGWVLVAMMLFAFSMNMAHIGSDWLWSAVIGVALVLILVLQLKPRGAGQRLRL